MLGSIGFDAINNWNIELKDEKIKLENQFVIPIYLYFYLDTPKCNFIYHVGRPKELHKDMLNGMYPIILITVQLVEE
jgi:hypothetical protein